VEDDMNNYGVTIIYKDRIVHKGDEVVQITRSAINTTLETHNDSSQSVAKVVTDMINENIDKPFINVGGIGIRPSLIIAILFEREEDR
jgi:cellobiose-specific phosphotransferase system component IIC